MSFLDHNGESEFPINKNQVFNAMCFAIPTIKGMKIQSADKLQGRILVKAGVSLFSWGENIPIQLSEVNENLTKVKITSSPKTGAMLGGAFDMGKNRKNIELILSATSQALQQNIGNQQTQFSSNNQAANNFSSQPDPNLTEKWYDKKWLVAVLCLFVFPVGLYALWKSSRVYKGWKIAWTIIILLSVYAALSKDQKGATASSANSSANGQSAPDAAATPWDYSTETDKMTSKQQYFATVNATNKLEFDFPYNGGSTGYITIRNMNQENSVLLGIDKGQFMGGEGHDIVVRFDNDAPIQFTSEESSDGDAKVLFMENSTQFITRIKTAKKMIVQADFYEKAGQQMEFDVSGLKWSH